MKDRFTSGVVKIELALRNIYNATHYSLTSSAPRLIVQKPELLFARYSWLMTIHLSLLISEPVNLGENSSARRGAARRGDKSAFVRSGTQLLITFINENLSIKRMVYGSRSCQGNLKGIFKNGFKSIRSNNSELYWSCCNLHAYMLYDGVSSKWTRRHPIISCGYNLLFHCRLGKACKYVPPARPVAMFCGNQWFLFDFFLEIHSRKRHIFMVKAKRTAKLLRLFRLKTSFWDPIGTSY